MHSIPVNKWRGFVFFQMFILDMTKLICKVSVLLDTANTLDTLMNSIYHANLVWEKTNLGVRWWGDLKHFTLLIDPLYDRNWDAENIFGQFAKIFAPLFTKEHFKF